LALLSICAFTFYRDYESVDSHLARANRDRLFGQGERIVKEYRSALGLEDDPHIHNLLAKELADEERWEEALAEYRAAERGREPDDDLPFNIALVLEGLNRKEDARIEYQKFLAGPRCKRNNPYPECEAADARARAK
jgi:Flp pilus assembly protein TadD